MSTNLSFIDYQEENINILNKLRSAAKLSQFKELFKAYLLLRFLLPSTTTEENLYELAKLSVSSTLKLEGKDDSCFIDKFDCHNISSPIKKKVQFCFHIERKLGIQFDEHKLVSLDTVDELAGYCYQLLREKDGCKE